MANGRSCCLFLLNRVGKYGFECYKSRRTAKCMIRSKVTTILPVFFSKQSKIQTQACKVFIQRHIVLRSQISFGQVYLKLDPKNGANFVGFQVLKVLYLQIYSPKTKSECTVQNSSPLPLEKHPTCLCFKFFQFFGKKNSGKIVVTFKPIMQFCCPSRFRIMKKILTHSVS